MKVECERCKTEYQFDDAIVSARGTTVRCTNCGHQFRVRRPDGEPGDDKFTVRRVDGTEITFESLRELQRAILSRAIVREDVLVRGAIKRELAAIAELRPLFEDKRVGASSRPPSAIRSNPPSTTAPVFEQTLRMGSVPSILPPTTSHGKKSSVPPPPLDRAPLAAPPQGKTGARDVAPETPAVQLPSKSSTLRPADTALPPIPIAPISQSSSAPTPSLGARHADVEPETLRRMLETDGEAETPIHSETAPVTTEATAPMANRGRSSMPPPLPSRASHRFKAVDVATPMASQTITAPLPIPHAAPPSLDLRPPRPPTGQSARPPKSSLRPSHAPASNASVAPLAEGKRPIGGVVIAVAIAACVAVLLVVVLRDKPATDASNDPSGTGANAAGNGSANQSPSDGDARVARFLDASQKALANGDIDGAKENVDKASAIAENDARVATQRVHVIIVRADLAWLAMQASSPAQTQANAPKSAETKIAADRLADALARFGTLDRAQCSPACLVDLERMNGHMDAARDRAKAIPEPSGLSGKFARAAIALVDKRWDGVVSELADATGDVAFGARERALLALGHARAGAAEKARTVVSGGAMPGYLATAIQSLLPADAKSDAAALNASNPSSATTATTGTTVAGGTIAPGTTEPAAGTDARDILKAADQARSKGEYDRALRLYSIALDRNARDSEALNGIAEIEHAQRNLAAARSSYQRVLSVNPSYLPALVGLGDVEYESGNAAGARKSYKDIMERFPEGSYPARVKQRGAEVVKPVESVPAPTASPKVPETSATTEPTP